MISYSFFFDFLLRLRYVTARFRSCSWVRWEEQRKPGTVTSSFPAASEAQGKYLLTSDYYFLSLFFFGKRVVNGELWRYFWWKSTRRRTRIACFWWACSSDSRTGGYSWRWAHDCVSSVYAFQEPSNEVLIGFCVLQAAFGS